MSAPTDTIAAQDLPEPSEPIRRVADRRRLQEAIQTIGRRARDPRDSLSAWWAADWIDSLVEP